MHELPSGYTARPPRDDDVDTIADVLRAHDLHHELAATLDAGFVRDQWATDGFDRSRDAWLVEPDHGGAVAYAVAIPDGPGRIKSWGVVHPDHLGRGIGSTLLDRIEARAGEGLADADEPRLHHAIDSGDRAAEELVRAHAFEHVRSFRHMQIDLEGPTDPGDPPPGIRIREVDPGDLRAIHAILVEAFREEWGYRVVPFDEWEANEVRVPSADLGLWLVADEGERTVGVLTATAWGERGWIGELGVLPSHRRRGIAGGLLRRSFAGFAGRGVSQVTLNVDAENPTDAVRLYERLGMRAVRGWELHERELG